MTTASLPTAIVTGAGSGIGRAIAHRLADDGYFLVIADRAEAGARETLRQLSAKGQAARVEILDITDPAATAALIAGCDQLRVLVNNAGIFNTRPLEALTPEDFRQMYEVNAVAMFTLSQQAAKVLPAGGRIVNLCSRAALGARGYTHYAASKAAVAGLTRAMALELAEQQITVNAIAPGVIATDMLLERKEGLEGLRVQQPTGKLGAPVDIAHAVAFFADPRADFITGQILLVDGGRSLGGTTAF